MNAFTCPLKKARAGPTYCHGLSSRDGTLFEVLGERGHHSARSMPKKNKRPKAKKKKGKNKCMAERIRKRTHESWRFFLSEITNKIY